MCQAFFNAPQTNQKAGYKVDFIKIREQHIKQGALSLPKYRRIPIFFG